MTSCESCTTQWATGARPDLAAHWQPFGAAGLKLDEKRPVAMDVRLPLFGKGSRYLSFPALKSSGEFRVILIRSIAGAVIRFGE
jgi:hypothetical protein